MHDPLPDMGQRPPERTHSPAFLTPFCDPFIRSAMMMLSEQMIMRSMYITFEN